MARRTLGGCGGNRRSALDWVWNREKGRGVVYRRVVRESLAESGPVTVMRPFLEACFQIAPDTAARLSRQALIKDGSRK